MEIIFDLHGFPGGCFLQFAPDPIFSIAIAATPPSKTQSTQHFQTGSPSFWPFSG